MSFRWFVSLYRVRVKGEMRPEQAAARKES